MKDSVDTLIEQWQVAIGGIDPRTEAS